MTEAINMTYENNVFYCTKNGTKWISIDGEKWYGEEKRIAELENKIADIKANCDLAIEGRDIKIKELEKENAELKSEKGCETCTKFDEVKLTKAKEILEELANKESEKMSNKKTVIVTKKDFFVRHYGVIVTCPHCKEWKLYFQSFEKRIDKTDTCPNCGKKVHIVSEE